ncbi:hypothetical protein RSOLAG22IIIB_04489 [Rhizoctonia solani]|uniref:Uncharacterized protein n=1 Tax=Rhizoctonia solani TaxID=456999 RepID=A0A0K6FY35_9AGAM|nr:hypothetical protein RSOLAG22IIIB_04489 [Rhizoctonia solani]
MEYWLSLLILLAEASLIVSVLDYDVDLELPSTLSYILKKLNHNLVRSPSALIGIPSRRSKSYPKENKKEIPEQTKQTVTYCDNNELSKKPGSNKTLVKQIQLPPGLNSSRGFFPRAPVSKGFIDTCAIHQGSVVGCATFFEHENYEYKLLCRGELYFRPKGTHTYRNGPIVPKKPGQLFTVKLDGTGSNVVTFCFAPSSRMLGEVNGYAEFLPVKTSIASSQEAHGLEYTQGEGCVFDWMYGDRSSSQYAWDYNCRYDVGWMHSSPATEELFDSNNELLAECCSLFSNAQNPLMNSLEGLDSIANFPPPDMFGEIQVGLAHTQMEPHNQLANSAQPIPSSSTQTSLPYLLAPAPQDEATTSSAAAPSKSVARRTCSICNRVMRRPSALTVISCLFEEYTMGANLG